MSILEQLVKFYKDYEGFHKTQLDEWNIRKYFRAMMNAGRLITCEEDGILLGYCDYSKMSYEQFGEAVLSDCISPELCHEYGNIVFVSTVCVAPEFRGIGVVRYLKNELIKRNPEAYYIVGRRQGKRYKPIVIFKGRKNKVEV